MGAYVRRNMISIFRIYSQYEPLRVFWSGSVVLGLGALAIFLRFLVTFIQDPKISGHTQSLILGGVSSMRRCCSARSA